MRLAICLSGQPRNYDKGWLYINEVFLKKYNPDVFIHTWLGEEFEQTDFKLGEPYKYQVDDLYIGKLYKLYEPKKLLAEEQILFDDKNIVMPIWRTPLQATKSMYYSIYKSNELKKQYEKENDFKYDAVIRLRMDVKFDYELDVEDIMNKYKNSINLFDWKMQEPFKSRGLDDWFALGNSENIDKYSDLFLYIDDYVFNDEKYKQFLNGDETLRNEYLLRWHLINNKINILKFGNGAKGISLER